MTQEFIGHGFDVRQVLRLICDSRTYQLSITKNKWNEDDKVNFSHANPRRLSAEQIYDAVAVATGSKPKFKDMPKGMRASEVPDGSVAGNDFLALFGRPQRQSACECERSGQDEGQPCGGKDCSPCATLESGVNLAALAQAPVRQPVWIESDGLAELLRKLAQLETDSLAEPPPLPPAIPPPPWREDLKMAQPVRGPSLAV